MQHKIHPEKPLPARNKRSQSIREEKLEKYLLSPAKKPCGRNQIMPVESDEILAKEWVHKQLEGSKYKVIKKLKVVVGTFNVNATIISDKDRLREWIRINEKAGVYAIGLQEVDMSAGALLREENKTFSKWNMVFSGIIPEDYEILASKQLVGLFLIVFVKKRVSRLISDIQIGTLNVGFFGLLGNKGGIAIRFNVMETSLCFLNSHLAAHQHKVEKRNQDQQYLEQIEFIETGKNYYKSNEKRKKENRINCQEHDYFFWFGDLNYRTNLPYYDTMKLIKRGDVKQLFNNDQLNLQQKMGKAFVGYEEAEVTFLPTFKFQKGKNKYVEYKEKKVRIPSYTDRILYMGKDVNPLSYNSFPNFVESDHRPVSGVYSINVEFIRKEKLRDDLFKYLDSRKNQQIPKLQLSGNTVDFQTIYYNSVSKREITFSNVGEMAVKFEILISNDKKIEDDFSKWLTIFPRKGVIFKEGKTKIDFSISINEENFHLKGKKSIDHVLIVRVENGPDYFIIIQGKIEEKPLLNFNF